MPVGYNVQLDEDYGYNEVFTRVQDNSVHFAEDDVQMNINERSIDGKHIRHLTVDQLIAGTITSETVTLAVKEGFGDVYFAGGTFDASTWTATSGFILGIDDTSSNREKFFIGDATSSLDWNVTAADTLTVKGTITATAGAIGGWTINATSLDSGTTNIVLDAGNKSIYINDATFGNAGIQIEYNSGTPRFHVGDGTEYFKYTGSAVQIASKAIEVLNGGDITFFYNDPDYSSILWKDSVGLSLDAEFGPDKAGANTFLKLNIPSATSVFTHFELQTKTVVASADDEVQLEVQSMASQTAAVFKTTFTNGNDAFIVYTGGQFIANEDGQDVDCRIEGVNDENLFFTDGSTDRVGIGTNSPDTKFQVNGAAKMTTIISAPDVDQAITSASDTISSAASHVEVTPDADYLMVSRPTITAGVDGQLLILHNLSATNTITLQDDSVFSDSDIFLGGAEPRILAGSTMTLHYSGDLSGWAVMANPNRATTFKSYTFAARPGASGEFFSGGFYDYSTTDSNLDEGSTTETHGGANAPYAAHAFIVSGGNGTTDGSDLVLTVSGTSITDAGVRTTTDSEVIEATAAVSAVNAYFETSKKWIGTVTFTLSSTGGSTFSYDFNYGFSKYEDFGNRNYTITDFEAVGLANANDTGFNVQLICHNDTGWTYAASGFVAGNTPVLDMNSEHSTEQDLDTGAPFAYKRSSLSLSVLGSAQEGSVIRVTTGTNNSVSYMDVHLGITIDP